MREDMFKLISQNNRVVPMNDETFDSSVTSVKQEESI